MGLILQLYQTIRSAAEDKELDSKELVLTMISGIFEYIKEDSGVIRLPIQDTIENQLQDLGTSLDTMTQLEEQEQKQKVVELILYSVNSKSLNQYKQDEHMESLLSTIINYLVEQHFSEENNKFVQFDKINSANIIEKYNHQGYVKYKPQFYREITMEDE